MVSNEPLLVLSLFCVFVLNSDQVDTVYFDMSRAFDRVNHKLLLHKLSCYGVSLALTRWFQCYRTDCKSSVRMSNNFYDAFVTFVPRASNSGPFGAVSYFY